MQTGVHIKHHHSACQRTHVIFVDKVLTKLMMFSSRKQDLYEVLKNVWFKGWERKMMLLKFHEFCHFIYYFSFFDKLFEVKYNISLFLFV